MRPSNATSFSCSSRPPPVRPRQAWAISITSSGSRKRPLTTGRTILIAIRLASRADDGCLAFSHRSRHQGPQCQPCLGAGPAGGEDLPGSRRSRFDGPGRGEGRKRRLHAGRKTIERAMQLPDRPFPESGMVELQSRYCAGTVIMTTRPSYARRLLSLKTSDYARESHSPAAPLSACPDAVVPRGQLVRCACPRSSLIVSLAGKLLLSSAAIGGDRGRLPAVGGQRPGRIAGRDSQRLQFHGHLGHGRADVAQVEWSLTTPDGRRLVDRKEINRRSWPPDADRAGRHGPSDARSHGRGAARRSPPEAAPLILPSIALPLPIRPERFMTRLWLDRRDYRAGRNGLLSLADRPPAIA